MDSALPVRGGSQAQPSGGNRFYSREASGRWSAPRTALAAEASAGFRAQGGERTVGYKEPGDGTPRESRAVSVQLTDLLALSAGRARRRC